MILGIGISPSFKRFVMHGTISAPTLVSTTIPAAGTTIEWKCDKAIDPDSLTGQEGQFAITEYDSIGDLIGSYPVSGVALKSGDDTVIVGTFSEPPNYAAILKSSYTKGTILAADGGVLESFINQDVTNSIPADTDAQALIDRIEALPYTLPAERKIIINNTFLAKKAYGLFTNWGDVEYFFSAVAESVALLNWIKDAHNATKVNTPTFTVDYGFTGATNTGRYLRSHYTPSAEAVNVSQNNMCISFYLHENLVVTTSALYGGKASNGTTYLSFVPYANDNYFSMNDSGAAHSTILTDNSGLISIDRTSSTNIKVYRNGVEVDSKTRASNGFLDVEMYILAAYNYLVSAAGKIAYFAVHRSMTAQEHADHYNHVILPYLNNLLSDNTELDDNTNLN